MNAIQQKHRDTLHAQKRIDECHAWLRTHRITHPEWSDMVSQLRIAELKLHRLTQPEPTLSFRTSTQEYSLPKFK